MTFFGLDIGSGGVRLVELRGNGSQKSLVKYAYVPVDSKIVLSDSPADVQQLTQVIRNLVAEAKPSTKNVAVGLPTAKVFTTVVDMDRLPNDQLGKALLYQAGSLIPTPPAESKIDWVLLGDSPTNAQRVELLLTSVPNSFVEQQLDMIEAAGLNVIAFEPNGVALARALLPPEASGAQLLVDIGNSTTDLVITLGNAPRLSRPIQTGADAIVRAAQSNLGVDDTQAQQFVFKFGVAQDKLEGQVYNAIIGTIDSLADEIDKSIKFFQARYTAQKIERIIVSGAASAIPDLPLYLANKFGVNVEIGNAWRNVTASADRQNELMAVSNQFGVAVGLAERAEK